MLAALRDLLSAHGFTEDGVAARRELAHRLETPLDALIRLFLDEESIPEDRIRALLGDESLEILKQTELLEHALCPVNGLWIASDRATRAKDHPDVVYPVHEQTVAFLNSLPETPCERLLDLGTGTGVAALIAAARYACHAWAADITERSVRFAELNRRINGLDNVTVSRGDLYEPVAGLTFDRIVAHPPYVPVASPTFVFRDGGEDGEQVLRGVIEGLPAHLEPGGRFYGYGMASDREGEPLEDRIRKWLGEHSDGFDLLLVATSIRSPEELKSPRGDVENDHWKRIFDKNRVKSIFYGSILAQKHAESSGTFTVRVLAAPDSGWRETEWLRGWMTAAAGGGQKRLLESRPRLSPRLELRAVHRARGGRLATEECTLAVDYPFQTECVCRPWLAQLVSGCDGESTGAQLLEKCRAQGLVPAGAAPEEFTRVLGSMVAAGILEIAGFPLPRAMAERP